MLYIKSDDYTIEFDPWLNDDEVAVLSESLRTFSTDYSKNTLTLSFFAMNYPLHFKACVKLASQVENIYITFSPKLKKTNKLWFKVNCIQHVMSKDDNGMLINDFIFNYRELIVLHVENTEIPADDSLKAKVNMVDSGQTVAVNPEDVDLNTDGC